MDVAKRLVDWRDQPPEQWLGAVNRYLPNGVTAFLVITISYQLAALTWTVVPGSTSVAILPSRALDAGNAAPAPDYSVLINARLFAETAEQPQVVAAPVVDAPATTLSLTLRGIVSKEGDPNGSAIIESNRGEKTYFVGQTIEGGDGATLHAVYADRVLLNRAGRLETLALPKEPMASGGSSMATPRLLPQAATATGTLRSALAENAARLTDIIRPAPHVQEGQVIGFRVTPGRDRAAFEALGFQSGDVVTDINGTVLDDASQSLQVVQSLGESTQATVTVLRDGVPQVIVIDTSQLQRLQENRR